MTYLNKDETDTANINNIPEHVWLKHYRDLWHTDKNDDNNGNKRVEVNQIDYLTMDELEAIMTSCKNKKSPGTDGINIELLKFASEEVKLRLLDILNICWLTCETPTMWKEAEVCPIFKKRIQNKL